MIAPLLRLASLATVLLLGGCSLLPEAEVVQIYLLPSPQAQASSQPRLTKSLGIARPLSSLTLESTRIAVVPQGSEISNYKGARWSDPVPSLLRDHLLEAFQRDGRFPALSSTSQHLQSDYVLTGNLLAFQSEYRNGKPEATIRLDARLVHTLSQRVIASRSFSVRQPSQDVAVPAVVQAFGQASDQIAAQLIDWTASQIRSAR